MRIRLGSGDEIPPPSSMNVEAEPRVLVYDAHDVPYVRRIGFAMDRRVQTTGTCPPLSDNTGKRKPKRGK